jgi:hypothetical protein
MRIKHQVVMFDAADLAGGSAFWAGVLGGRSISTCGSRTSTRRGQGRAMRPLADTDPDFMITTDFMITGEGGWVRATVVRV